MSLELKRMIHLFGGVLVSSLVGIALLKAVLLNNMGDDLGCFLWWLAGQGAFCVLLNITSFRTCPEVWSYGKA